MTDIQDWIEEQIESGYSIDQIKEVMEKSGWDPVLVDKYIQQEKKDLTRIKILSVSMVALVSLLVVFYFFGFFGLSQYVPSTEVIVSREIVRDTVRPSEVSTVRIVIEGDYRSLEVKENIPEEFGISDEGAGSFDSESSVVRWSLTGEEEVEYVVSTPGASSGTFIINGTYSHGFSTGYIEGDEELEVRW